MSKTKQQNIGKVLKPIQSTYDNIHKQIVAIYVKDEFHEGMRKINKSYFILKRLVKFLGGKVRENPSKEAKVKREELRITAEAKAKEEAELKAKKK